MVEWFVHSLRAAPELGIFLTLGLGFWLGAIKFGKFNLGAVTATLLVGVLVGQIGLDISPQIKSIFFIMFLFAVGYGVGPQFVVGIAHDGVPQAIFAVVISALCLGSVYLAAEVAGYGVGSAIGLLAGSQTISASIGVATDALNNSTMTAEEIKTQLNAIPVAYAVTYIFGTIGTGLILSLIGPKILRVDLAAECRRYEEEMSKGTPDGGIETAWHQYIVRAFRLHDPKLLVGKTVAEAEQSVSHSRIFLEQLRRDGKIIPFTADTVLQLNDVIAVSGPHSSIVHWSNHAEEVEDHDLLAFPMESAEVLLTSKSIHGRTLIDIATEDYARGVYIDRIRRGMTSVDIPVKAQTKVYRGDMVSLKGSKTHIDNIVKQIGYVDRTTDATSMVMVGLAIFIGGVIGSLALHVGQIPITLSTSGGALLAGLLFGWLRSFNPKIGGVPAPSLWFMNNVGLNVFIAIVGISAGPTFFAGLADIGVGMFFWGLFATSVPMLLAPFIGKYIFRFDPAINLGCCGGARTSTASVAMVADVAKSNVPMLGYTVPYAISNTLLTLWGLAIVMLVV